MKWKKTKSSYKWFIKNFLCIPLLLLKIVNPPRATRNKLKKLTFAFLNTLRCKLKYFEERIFSFWFLQGGFTISGQKRSFLETDGVLEVTKKYLFGQIWHLCRHPLWFMVMVYFWKIVFNTNHFYFDINITGSVQMSLKIYFVWTRNQKLFNQTSIAHHTTGYILKHTIIDLSHSHCTVKCL